MRSCNAEDLLAHADSLLVRLAKPTNTDDPLWGLRSIEGLRRAAARREKAAITKRIDRARRRHR